MFARCCEAVLLVVGDEPGYVVECKIRQLAPERFLPQGGRKTEGIGKVQNGWLFLPRRS